MSFICQIAAWYWQLLLEGIQVFSGSPAQFLSVCNCCFLQARLNVCDVNSHPSVFCDRTTAALQTSCVQMLLWFDKYATNPSLLPAGPRIDFPLTQQHTWLPDPFQDNVNWTDISKRGVFVSSLETWLGANCGAVRGKRAVPGKSFISTVGSAHTEASSGRSQIPRLHVHG